MKIISVWSPKGGVGKTTLTAHLADCLTVKHGKRVLAYDADPQLALYNTYKRGGFAFDVTDQYPNSRPDCDFFIVDFRPTANLNNQEKTIIQNSSVVVAPVRASRLDLDSAKAINSLVEPENLINVLSCFDKRVSDQKEVRTHLAPNHELISYLAIYARTMNDYKTIFTRETDSLNGTKRARTEVQALVNNILEKTHD
ncbi:ParA family protein [Pseudoalteromonas sp. APAL1]|uniref:ParA family protein n=1 Tax=unclassified Pseudoalteromonas TaxID=194690 RepID=UPI001EF7BAC3|nr:MULTISPECIES: ParA family protein [unclassified Pseudoalteromonas]MCF2922883.1 ParA family protein [Pseudoalteromonas sp. APAL1]MCG7556260.1 ParA family protein [Pseudoalteromonas sp. Of11M-6]